MILLPLLRTLGYFYLTRLIKSDSFTSRAVLWAPSCRLHLPVNSDVVLVARFD